MPGKAIAYPAVLVLSLGSLAPAQAQAPAEGELDLAPGARIRVTMANPSPSGGSGARFVGSLVDSDCKELKLEVSESETRRLPRDEVVRLEQSVSPSRKTRGLWIGFGLGLAAMFGKAAAQGGCNDGCNSANVLEAFVFALGTATVGAIVSPGEHWMDVAMKRQDARATMPVETGLEVRLVPVVGRRTGLSLVASF